MRLSSWNHAKNKLDWVFDFFVSKCKNVAMYFSISRSLQSSHCSSPTHELLSPMLHLLRSRKQHGSYLALRLLNQIFLTGRFRFSGRNLCHHVSTNRCRCTAEPIPGIWQLCYDRPLVFSPVITLYWRHSHVTIRTTEYVDFPAKCCSSRAVTFGFHICGNEK